MINYFPYLNIKLINQITELLASEQAANQELAFQLLLGQSLKPWQVFSLLGYLTPMRETSLWAGLEDEENRLWKMHLQNVVFELGEWVGQRSTIMFYLKTEDEKWNIPGRYSKAFGRLAKQQDIEQAREMFIKYVFTEQEKINNIFQ